MELNDMMEQMPAAEENVGGPNSTAVTSEEIELLNANGPYNHAVWRGRGLVISHEEGLTGRVEYLSSQIRNAIQQSFSTEQLAKMTIVDVGCYDGWMLESLSDLPFARMVGIEPRTENIARGRRIREILRIPSRVVYQAGEIDTLDKVESFDIVMCLGVLHHLESIATGLRKLHAICRQMLVVETLCLPSAHLGADLRRDVELKDIVYRYKPQVFGITAQKYETGYFPGSSVRLSIVNVPSVETLKMQLDVLGCQKVEVVADWEQYRKALPLNQRPVNAVCLSALVDRDHCAGVSQETKWLEDYETRMLSVILPAELIVPLHQAVCVGADESELPEAALAVYQALQGPQREKSKLHRLVHELLDDATRRELVASFAYAPVDKVRLEYAKHLFVSGEQLQAAHELSLITTRPNADWRACYRAFYLLWRLAVSRNDVTAASRYRDFCLTCNPAFPGLLFRSPPVIQQPVDCEPD